MIRNVTIMDWRDVGFHYLHHAPMVCHSISLSTALFPIGIRVKELSATLQVLHASTYIEGLSDSFCFLLPPKSSCLCLTLLWFQIRNSDSSTRDSSTNLSFFVWIFFTIQHFFQSWRSFCSTIFKGELRLNLKFKVEVVLVESHNSAQL